ncbi:phage tail protein [Pasteurella multocida]
MRLKYQVLTDYLLSKIPSHYHANFYSWMDDGELVNEGKEVTEKGEILFYLEYTAELFFHELPFKKINPLWIMTYLKIWLDENDLERCIQDDYKTPFELTMLSDDLADLGFSVKFREPIYLNQLADEQLDTETEIWHGNDIKRIELFVNSLVIDKIQKEQAT